MTAATWQLLIPALVPVAIAMLKLMIPGIPKPWLPVLAPLLGGLLDAGTAYAGISSGANPLVGALLGSAGVGLREIVDQLRKAGTSQ